MKRKGKQKAPNFINLAQNKLIEHFNAQVFEKAFEILTKKGYDLTDTQLVFSFFKDRVKSFTKDGVCTLAVEDKPFMSYKSPNFKQKGFDVTIGFEYTEL